MANVYKTYKAPNYTVDHSAGRAEIRTYAPHNVAEVAVQGNRSVAASRAFRILAGYIFGKNETGVKMAMTSPVSQIPAGEGYIVRFMLPDDLALAELPAPKDTRVRLQEVSPGRQAVMRFTGRWTPASLAKQEMLLRDFMAAKGLTTRGPVHYYFYDDPFTVPWKRRNEVAFPVDEDPARDPSCGAAQ